jgi:putative chitinase
MAIKITRQQISQLAPSARSSYREAFASGQSALDRYGISDSPLRVIHFMAQVLHESAGLTVQFENLNYSAQRLSKVWPRRFKPKGPLNADDYAHAPRKLANAVYGGRIGNKAPNDGYLYRGRGLLQLTGRDSYQQATALVRYAAANSPDFVDLPDEVISAEWCLLVAATEWASKDCNRLADQDSIIKITRAINGGQVGLGDRVEWLNRTRTMWGRGGNEPKRSRPLLTVSQSGR